MKHTFLPGMTHEVIVWQVDSPHLYRDIQGKQCDKVGREYLKPCSFRKESRSHIRILVMIL